MSCLANFRFYTLGQGKGGIDAIDDHVANLRRNKH